MTSERDGLLLAFIRHSDSGGMYAVPSHLTSEHSDIHIQEVPFSNNMDKGLSL